MLFGKQIKIFWGKTFVRGLPFELKNVPFFAVYIHFLESVSNGRTFVFHKHLLFLQIERNDCTYDVYIDHENTVRFS